MATRVLVTGGAGFIGSHLADALLARGDEVAVVDDLSAGRAGRLPRPAALHRLSITDGAALDGVVRDLRPALVFHLAAQINVRASVAAPAADAAANVVGTVNVLEAARAVGARLVFCSSGGAVYGQDAPIPSLEDVLLQPESPYGIAKQGAEQYIGLYNRLHGTAHAVLRLSNVYGPRQDPSGQSGVVPIFSARILAGQRPVVFGDGQQTRDYVYVRDAVAAVLAAADRGRHLEHRDRPRGERPAAGQRHRIRRRPGRRAGVRAAPPRRAAAQRPGHHARGARPGLAPGHAAAGRRARRAALDRGGRRGTRRLLSRATRLAVMPRPDGRRLDQLRDVKITRNWLDHAEGSVLVEFGGTRVLCAATVNEEVPRWRRGSGQGWVTAEYAMLPRSTNTRTDRESVKGRLGGRTHEISRLVGRSLRACIDPKAMGENTVIIDCDVLQADGGTRTAAITGGYVALVDAITWLKGRKRCKGEPLVASVSAVSVGILDGQPRLDLCYEEDVIAETDMNVVCTGDGRFVEVQGTAEREPFDRKLLDQLLDLAVTGCAELTGLQQAALAP